MALRGLVWPELPLRPDGWFLPAASPDFQVPGAGADRPPGTTAPCRREKPVRASRIRNTGAPRAIHRPVRCALSVAGERSFQNRSRTDIQILGASLSSPVVIEARQVHEAFGDIRMGWSEHAFPSLNRAPVVGFGLQMLSQKAASLCEIVEHHGR